MKNSLIGVYLDILINDGYILTGHQHVIKLNPGCLVEKMTLSAQGLYSLSGKTSYCKISWSLEAARFGFKLFQSLWNLAGTSTALLPRCLSNFRAIRPLQHPISRLRDLSVFQEGNKRIPEATTTTRGINKLSKLNGTHTNVFVSTMLKYYGKPKAHKPCNDGYP